MITWLFGTAPGRFVLTALIVLLSWWGFSSYYLAKGRAECRAAAAAAFIEQEAKGRDVAKVADNEAAIVVRREDAERTLVVTEIRTVYRERPTQPAVATGSCVYPVEPSVQAALQAQLDRANGVKP